jgi:hypothetical protein
MFAGRFARSHGLPIALRNGVPAPAAYSWAAASPASMLSKYMPSPNTSRGAGPARSASSSRHVGRFSNTVGASSAAMAAE